MIDWGERIDQLVNFLARQFTVEDRVAVEVLLSALIHCPRTPATWICLEIPWFTRDCWDAWFAFGGLWVPQSLPRLRARSPWRQIEAEITEWVDSPSDEHLWIEPDHDRYPYFNHLTQAHFLLLRSLRIRMRSPRAADPLKGLDKYNRDRIADELNSLTRHVIEDRLQSRPANPPEFIQPANFLFHIELVQRLAPWYTDWTTLVQIFAALGVRHAYLYGRTETAAADYQAMARVAADSIPPWIAKAMRHLLEGPAQTQPLETRMGLEEKTRRSGHGAHRELIRLRRAGLVEWHPRRMSWALVERFRQGVADVLEGYAFGVERGRAA